MNNWKENKIVKKIYELRKNYEHKFSYGTIISFNKTKIENLHECACCGTLMELPIILYHKTEDKSIYICNNCNDLWKILPKRILKK